MQREAVKGVVRDQTVKSDLLAATKVSAMFVCPVAPGPCPNQVLLRVPYGDLQLLCRKVALPLNRSGDCQFVD